MHSLKRLSPLLQPIDRFSLAGSRVGHLRLLLQNLLHCILYLPVTSVVRAVHLHTFTKLTCLSRPAVAFSSSMAVHTTEESGADESLDPVCWSRDTALRQPSPSSLQRFLLLQLHLQSPAQGFQHWFCGVSYLVSSCCAWLLLACCSSLRLMASALQHALKLQLDSMHSLHTLDVLSQGSSIHTVGHLVPSCPA